MTCLPPCGAHFCFICGKKVAARRSGHWQKGGCPRFGVAGPRLIWDRPDEHSEGGTDASDEEDQEDEDDEDDDETGRLDLIQDLMRIDRLIDVFDNAADAERVESNRMRIIRGVASPNSESRIRFFGYISTNFSIVHQVMQTRFDVEHVPGLLAEFNERHRRISTEYPVIRDSAEAQVGTVTQLSDLSDEFDAYFVFALETITDLEGIAGAQRRRP